jgi:hypothetical protein
VSHSYPNLYNRRLRYLVSYSSLTSRDVDSGLRLSKRFGSSPKLLLSILNKYQKSPSRGALAERSYEKKIDAAVEKLSENFKLKILNYDRLEMYDNLSSTIFFVRPLPDTNQTEPCIALPTDFIADRFLFALIAAKTNDQIHFFSMMLSHPWARAAAGHMFETAGHAFLTHPTGPHMVAHASDGSKYDIAPVMQVLPSQLSSLHTEVVPVYWYPARENFGGVDSVKFEERGIFVFQFTISAKHGSPVSGLVKIRNEVSMNTKQKPWYLVYVGLKMEEVVRLGDVGTEQLRVAVEDDNMPPWLLDIKVLSAVITFGSGLSGRLEDFIVCALFASTNA